MNKEVNNNIETEITAIDHIIEELTNSKNNLNLKINELIKQIKQIDYMEYQEYFFYFFLNEFINYYDKYLQERSKKTSYQKKYQEWQNVDKERLLNLIKYYEQKDVDLLKSERDFPCYYYFINNEYYISPKTINRINNIIRPYNFYFKHGSDVIYNGEINKQGYYDLFLKKDITYSNINYEKNNRNWYYDKKFEHRPTREIKKEEIQTEINSLVIASNIIDNQINNYLEEKNNMLVTFFYSKILEQITLSNDNDNIKIVLEDNFNLEKETIKQFLNTISNFFIKNSIVLKESNIIKENNYYIITLSIKRKNKKLVLKYPEN